MEKTVAAPCRHWWIIEDHRSRYSPGQCKLCGEERVFDNYPDSYDLHGQGTVYRKMADNNFRASGRSRAVEQNPSGVKGVRDG